HASHIGFAALRNRPIGAHAGRRQHFVSFPLAELHFLMDLLLVLGDQEHDFAAAYAYGVAVAQQLAANRNAVDEGAVVAVEINQMESDVGPADGEMPAGNRAITEAKMIGRIASDRKLLAFQPNHGALGWP